MFGRENGEKIASKGENVRGRTMEGRLAIGEEAIPSQSVRCADKKKSCPNIKPSVLSGNI